MIMDDVLLNKAAIIERCVKRVHSVDLKSPGFEQDANRQDVVILNIQRACEAAIDMAAHLVRMKRLGAPQTSRDFFDLLATNNLISQEINKRMQAMVGFRNIAIHDYQKINLLIVKSIVEKNLKDFTDFSSALLKTLNS